jgi:hypothetical protein
MKSLGALVIAALVAVTLGVGGAFAVANSIDKSPTNSDSGAAERIDETKQFPEIYGTK